MGNRTQGFDWMASKSQLDGHPTKALLCGDNIMKVKSFLADIFLEARLLMINLFIYEKLFI